MKDKKHTKYFVESRCQGWVSGVWDVEGVYNSEREALTAYIRFKLPGMAVRIIKREVKEKRIKIKFNYRK